ncbi:PREDICTED: zinc finger BED domain-containing protein RICESLEEPER 4-like [Ipomoea nil]|uniref:zinc finger BED domain-containing protein RICESLEEPER 4-like n=1 Tax=Ipomoea nil TaxID=35883 RepID=UPI000901101F|nr:PREDICTED: zinc finger BED domain-containing protein RICESLEEPER 4-like [Ipomoea nil]
MIVRLSSTPVDGGGSPSLGDYRVETLVLRGIFRGNQMESISQPSSGPQPSTQEGQGQPQGTEIPQQPQVTPVVPQKKRKEVESRSRVWEHFVKIYDKENNLIEGRCIYCSKIFCCQPKKHGTSSLRNHMVACLKNPHSKDTRQSLLTFNAVSSSAPGCSEGVMGELGTWVFNQETIRRALCEMIIIDELPFRFVDGIGFRRFILVACPRFQIPSRWTVSKDIFQIYLDERSVLKQIFKGCSQRVSLTTDTWTSVQRINYMCITAHFIDDQWKLNKKIIAFVPVSSHRGEYIAKALETCLVQWGIKNVFTVTVDNASSNDTAMGFFKSKLMSWGTTSVRSKYMHMRCIAHILNLVVQDGLKFADTSVKRVREAVRWVRNSPARLKKFRDLAELIGVEAKSVLQLDVPTRWNSTYMMLNTAIHLVTLLKTFYDMAVRISGSLYVTSNTFFSEICDLSCMLDDMTGSESESESEKLTQLYGDEKGKACFEKVQSALLELYNDYAATYSVDVNTEPAAVAQPSQTVSVSVQPSAVTVGRPQGKLKSQLKRQRMESGGSLKQTDLQIYLSEAIVEDKVDFDILKWWKVNSERLPILSKMARDILAVPISTDWLRLPNQPIQIEENIDDCERLEKELPTGVRTAGTSLPTIAVMFIHSALVPQPLPQFHLIEHLNIRLQLDRDGRRILPTLRNNEQREWIAGALPSVKGSSLLLVMSSCFTGWKLTSRRRPEPAAQSSTAGVRSDAPLEVLRWMSPEFFTIAGRITGKFCVCRNRWRPSELLKVAELLEVDALCSSLLLYCLDFDATGLADC